MILYNDLKTGDILEIKHNNKKMIVYFLEFYNQEKYSLIVINIKGKKKNIFLINRDEVIKKYY